MCYEVIMEMPMAQCCKSSFDGNAYCAGSISSGAIVDSVVRASSGRCQ